MRTWHPATSGLRLLSWTVLRKESQQFSSQGAELLPVPPCNSLKPNLEAYRCWCAAWTSNPTKGVISISYAEEPQENQWGCPTIRDGGGAFLLVLGNGFWTNLAHGSSSNPLEN